LKNDYDSFEIAMLIREIYSRAMNVVEENLAYSNFTHQQIIVIRLIECNNEMTISELCKEMSLAKGTVSGIVSRLVHGGYLVKSKNEDDKRNIYIRFSPKGFELAEKFKNSIQESFDKIFKDCTQKEMDEFVDSLKNILLKLRGADYGFKIKDSLKM